MKANGWRAGTDRPPAVDEDVRNKAHDRDTRTGWPVRGELELRIDTWNVDSVEDPRDSIGAVAGARLASPFSVVRATRASPLRITANARGIQNLLRVRVRGFSAGSNVLGSPGPGTIELRGHIS
jgi:hypothetical protein